MELPYKAQTVSEKETALVAINYSSIIKAPQFTAIRGDLGMGKSHFARSFIGYFNPKEYIPSPTFNIIHYYDHGPMGIPIAHIDLYKIEGQEQLNGLDLKSLLRSHICLIEWADKHPWVINNAIHIIDFTYLSDNSREILIKES